MDIEQIKQSNWLILHSNGTFYNRVIARVISVKFRFESLGKKYYMLTCAIAESFQNFQLIEYDGSFFVNIVSDKYDLLYSVKTATNNIFEHLIVGDTLIFKNVDIESDTPIYNIKAKITKIQKKYGRVLVHVFDESKNLSTVIKKYGAIHAVKTADIRYLMQSVKEVENEKERYCE